MSDGDRIRMDRSLDEIAAEMHSGESFGRGYEERETNPADSRGRDARRSRRYAPYSPGGGGGGRDSGRGEREERGGARQQQQQSQQYQKGGGRNCRVFVGNLHYSTTWQALKDHMRRGAFLIARFTTTPLRCGSYGEVFFSFSPLSLSQLVRSLGVISSGRPMGLHG